MQASRPLGSVALKMFCWMLANVGVRFGVGPVRLLSFSSHALPASTAKAVATYIVARRIRNDLQELSFGRKCSASVKHGWCHSALRHARLIYATFLGKRRSRAPDF